MIAVGAPAPEFLLPDQSGSFHTLDHLTENGALLLVFYPGDFRMVCTKQLCAYQNYKSQFDQLGVQIVGISANVPKEHLSFAQEFEFSFPLLSDLNRAAAKAYGVISLLLLGGTGRAVFLISKSGKVLYRYVEPTILSYRKPNELLTIAQQFKKAGLI